MKENYNPLVVSKKTVAELPIFELDGSYNKLFRANILNEILNKLRLLHIDEIIVFNTEDFGLNYKSKRAKNIAKVIYICCVNDMAFLKIKRHKQLVEVETLETEKLIDINEVLTQYLRGLQEKDFGL